MSPRVISKVEKKGRRESQALVWFVVIGVTCSFRININTTCWVGKAALKHLDKKHWGLWLFLPPAKKIFHSQRLNASPPWILCIEVLPLRQTVQSLLYSSSFDGSVKSARLRHLKDQLIYCSMRLNRQEVTSSDTCAAINQTVLKVSQALHLLWDNIWISLPLQKINKISLWYLTLSEMCALPPITVPATRYQTNGPILSFHHHPSWYSHAKRVHTVPRVWGCERAGGFRRKREFKSPFPSIRLLPAMGLFGPAPAL